MSAGADTEELTSLELITRVEARVLAAGNAVGMALVGIDRGVSDEDQTATLHDAMNDLTKAIFDLDRLSRDLKEADRG